jgi:hypothetical protein
MSDSATAQDNPPFDPHEMRSLRVTRAELLILNSALFVYYYANNFERMIKEEEDADKRRHLMTDAAIIKNLGIRIQEVFPDLKDASGGLKVTVYQTEEQKDNG